MIDRISINPDFLPKPDGGFNRAVELNFGKFKVLLIAGTASVGPTLQTIYPDNFESQLRHTYNNIKQILVNRSFEIKHVVKWRIYLRDINKYYKSFNKIRDEFFKENNISREYMGVSTCIEAKLCRGDLLVEIEAVALKEVN